MFKRQQLLTVKSTEISWQWKAALCYLWAKISFITFRLHLLSPSPPPTPTCFLHIPTGRVSSRTIKFPLQPLWIWGLLVQQNLLHRWGHLLSSFMYPLWIILLWDLQILGSFMSGYHGAFSVKPSHQGMILGCEGIQTQEWEHKHRGHHRCLECQFLGTPIKKRYWVYLTQAPWLKWLF